jgi:hypothetical protein
MSYRQAALELHAAIRDALAWIGSGNPDFVAHNDLRATADRWRDLLEDEADAEGDGSDYVPLLPRLLPGALCEIDGRYQHGPRVEGAQTWVGVHEPPDDRMLDLDLWLPLGAPWETSA